MNIVDAFADVARFVDLRRDIHAHPELGFEEHRTSALVAKLLAEWGIEVHAGIAGTGLVGVLRKRTGGATEGRQIRAAEGAGGLVAPLPQ